MLEEATLSRLTIAFNRKGETKVFDDRRVNQTAQTWEQSRIAAEEQQAESVAQNQTRAAQPGQWSCDQAVTDAGQYDKGGPNGQQLAPYGQSS